MNTTLKIALFVALLLTGISTGVAFAHFLELPNKMTLSATDYLLVVITLLERGLFTLFSSYTCDLRLVFDQYL